MPLFRRGRRQEEPSEPDGTLPLTAAQAQRFRALVRTAWAEAGREVTMYAGHVVDDEGTQFGLWNLAALCNAEAERDWPTVIRQHVRALSVPTPGIDNLTDDELRPMVRSRLVDRGSLPDTVWQPSAREFVGDLVERLCVDFPDHVMTPRESEFTDRGGALGPWLDAGRHNLHAELAATALEHEEVTPPDGTGWFDVVMSESVYTASFAIFLAEVLGRVGRHEQGRGVLVAVPFRHQIAFRVVDHETADLPLALQHLFQFALAGYADAPGGITPHVFWVRDGSWRQVTRLDGDQATIQVDEELARLLGLADG